MEARINKLITSVLESEDMSDGVVTIKNANVEITDELMSEIYRVNVTKEGSTDNKQELNLIVKLSPNAPPHYQKIVKILYASEIHYYAAVAPGFNDLQMKYLGKPFSFTPKYYGAVKDGSQEVIFMDDLLARGYKMLDTKYVFRDEYLKTVLRELGKFHALSFALQSEDPDLWKKLDFPVNQSEVYTAEIIQWFRESLKKIADLFGKGTYMQGKIMLLHDNFPSDIKKFLTPSKRYPSAIVHMDPWCNNFMFKHGENREIEDVVLIDFQTATKGSPVLDVSCFLYINASTDALDSWQDMLTVYYDSLCSHGKALNCSVEKVYSWDMFMEDWKEYAVYGLIKACMGSFHPEDQKDDKPRDAKTIGADFFAEKLDTKTNERLKGLICLAVEENFI